MAKDRIEVVVIPYKKKPKISDRAGAAIVGAGFIVLYVLARLWL